MPAIKDEAIVLRRLDYSESSQVLAFFTREHGTQRLIAKGVKRSTKTRFTPGIDLLERGHVVFIPPSRNPEAMGTLTEWRQVDAYLRLREDLPRLYAAQYAAEITSALTESGDPHAELFDAMAMMLDALCGGEDPLVETVGYQCAMLEAAGVWPDLGRCMVCDKPAPPGRAGYYSANQGGLLCRECEPGVPEKRKVSAALLEALRGQAFTPENARGAFDVLNYTLSHAMGRAPALARFVR